MRAALVLSIVALAGVNSAESQTRLAPAASVLFDDGHSPREPTLHWAEPDTTKHIHGTYWKEGALIGGGLGALGGAFLFRGFCQDDDSAGEHNCGLAAVGGALIGAIILGIPGALIGGSFDKHPPVDSAPVGEQ